MSKIHLSVMLVICLAAGVVFYHRWNPLNREAGESRHYVASTVTLLNAGRISFTKQDMRDVEDVFGKLIPYKFPHWLRYSPSDRTLLHKLATMDAKTSDFLGRSFYWGTYSFLCIPIYWFCRTFHIFDSNMFNAFKWTNILMLLVPLITIVFLLNGSIRTKYLMLGAFAFPAAAQYISWASAECCIYMLVTLCLIFLYNREYCRSSLCLSFAATLNYCVAPVALVILFCFLRDHWNDFSFKPFRIPKEFIKEFLLLGCCYLPVVHAAGWTWLQFSRIGTMTFAASADFLWERFWAYLFDLNLGMWVYHPFLFTIFLFSIFVIIWKRDWELMLLWFSLFGIVLGYSFMPHIQCGMEGISRYGAWSAPVAVYVAVCVLDRYSKAWVSISLLIASVVLSCTGLTHPFYASTRLSSVAEFVLNHCPQIYDPFYPLFNYRVARLPQYSPPPSPVVYYKGACGKILVWNNQLTDFWKYMKAYTINDATFRTIEKQRKKLMKQKRLYYYINLDKSCILYLKEQTFDLKKLAFIGNARSDGNNIRLDKDGLQFGPYTFVIAGNYRVRITGDNLNKLQYYCSANCGKKRFLLNNMKCSKTLVEYEVNFPISFSRVEFISRNRQSEPCKIANITLIRL